jgi:hypothetical protein
LEPRHRRRHDPQPWLATAGHLVLPRPPDYPADDDRYEPHDVRGRAYLVTSFDDDCGVEGVAWAHTVAAVLANTTERAARHSGPAAR